MKKILAIAAVAALTTGGSVYAANPFSDVTRDDWAYQAISTLSDQGIVEGYPDGTFRGERNMTRYELAQVIARLMAREDRLDAQQQAMLNRLAAEYADELANLGVRVSNLEKKVGNFYWSGDARMQYQHNLNGMEGHEDAWGGRVRIHADAAVNEHIMVSARLQSEMDFKGSKDNNGDQADVTVDRIHAKWTPTEKAYVDLGRTGVALDRSGVFWDEDAVFDGVVAGFGTEKFMIEGGYGRFKSAELMKPIYGDEAATESWFAKLSGGTEAFQVSGFYLKPVQNFANTPAGESRDGEVWGAGLTVGTKDKLSLEGDYIRSKTTFDREIESNLWTAGLTYGEVDTDVPGSFSLGVRYVDSEMGSMVFAASALDMTDHLDYGFMAGGDITFWQARLGVALQKGLELDAYYSFGADITFGPYAHGNLSDPDDVWGVELNYAF